MGRMIIHVEIRTPSSDMDIITGLFDARVKPYKCPTPTRSRILNPAALVSRLSPTVYAALVVILSIPSMSAVLEAKTTTSGSQHRFEPRDEPSEDLRQLF